MKAHFNLPFFECVFNLVFMPTPEYDLTIPGLFLSKVQDGYTKKRDIPERKMRLRSLTGDDSEILVTSLTQFISNDQTFVSQIGKDVFAFNQINNYLNWERFKIELLKLLHEYSSLIHQEQIRAINLPYASARVSRVLTMLSFPLIIQ